MTRFSSEQIETLKKLLKEQTGRDYTDKEAQDAGLAIIRFVLAKEVQAQKRKQEALSNRQPRNADDHL